MAWLFKVEVKMAMCPMCGGLGKDIATGKTTCWKCGGHGVVSDPRPARSPSGRKPQRKGPKSSNDALQWLVAAIVLFAVIGALS